jgi:hypothetical protein
MIWVICAIAQVMIMLVPGIQVLSPSLSLSLTLSLSPLIYLFNLFFSRYLFDLL